MASNPVQLGLQVSNQRILRSLEVDSEILDRIHRDFIEIVSQKGIKIHPFQESSGFDGI